MRRGRLAAAIVIAAGLPALAIVPAQASAGVTATARTCSAFRTWDEHRTAANLDTLAADSFGAPWRYVGYDVWGLYADVRSGSVKYITADVRYLTGDCP
jgi:hypothetical protein